MNTSVKLAALAVSAAVFTLGASATPVTPGGGAVTASNAISVTNDGTVLTGTGTVQSGGATAGYTEIVEKDGSNPFGTDDLTFLLTISSSPGSTDITVVSLKDGFDALPNLNVGYIAGPGQDGTSAPTKIAENANGVVDFRFPGSDAIVAGTGTEYLVVQTAFTSLPSGTANGGLGTVSITAAAAATPEPGSLALFATGLLAAGAVIGRRRTTA